MKSIQSRILLSCLLLATCKTNSMSWEEVAIMTGADPDQIMAESRRRTAELNEIIAARNAQEKAAGSQASTSADGANADTKPTDNSTPAPDTQALNDAPAAASSTADAGSSTASQPHNDATTGADDSSDQFVTPPASPRGNTTSAPDNAATASTSSSALKATYAELVASNASGLGHIADSMDKAPADSDADSAQLSTDDVAGDDDTDGPLPSHPAPTDDDDENVPDLVDDSEPSIATPSSTLPQASTSSSALPTEYAFVTNGDSAQRAEAELLDYATRVLNGVGQFVDAKDHARDAKDAQAIVSWATHLHETSKTSQHFIIVPKATLDAVLARLKQLGSVYYSNKFTLKAETNFTNPKGMGSIDNFNLPIDLVLAQPAIQSNPLAQESDDWRDDNDDDWTTDEEDEEWFDSQPTQADVAQIEYSVVEDEDALLNYAQEIKAGIETKIKEITQAEKLLFEETLACDTHDIAEIISWINALKNSNAAGIPNATIDKVMRRLHQLARVYSKKNNTIALFDFGPALPNKALFDREINIYVDDESSDSTSSSSSSDTDGASSGNDDASSQSSAAAPALPDTPDPNNAPALPDDNNDDSESSSSASAGAANTDAPKPDTSAAAPDKNNEEDDDSSSSSWSADIGLVSDTPENLAGIDNTDLFAKYANEVAAATLAKTDAGHADYIDAHEICKWAESMAKITQIQDTWVGVPAEKLDTVLRRLHTLATKYHRKNIWIKASNAQEFKTSDVIFTRDIAFLNTTTTPPTSGATLGAQNTSAAKDDNDDDDDTSSSSSNDLDKKKDATTQDKNKADTPKKADSKSQSDGSTSDDEDEDDDSSLSSAHDDNKGKGPQKPSHTSKAPKTPPVTSSFTGNILKLVKNKLVLTGGAVAAAVWYWHYYYAQEDTEDDLQTKSTNIKQEKLVSVAA